ncbi:tRNA adenosine(34) deaminase TadA [Desulforamulus aquiferis]|uniref:tRNA adenosine(34) deaminase TadA n=1 Tax=Desulforamulus aquiferis TaxID=1397668 RepID=UPI003F8D6EC3
MSHASYMREALLEAEKAAAKGEVPIGAVVVAEGEIVGRGHDLRESLCDASAHAEILAMREAAGHLGDWRLNHATLYVTVEPCAMCAGAIVQFRVRRLVYGAPNPKHGSVDTILDIVNQPRFNHRVEVISGIMEDECREVIQKFFKSLRNK